VPCTLGTVLSSGLVNLIFGCHLSDSLGAYTIFAMVVIKDGIVVSIVNTHANRVAGEMMVPVMGLVAGPGVWAAPQLAEHLRSLQMTPRRFSSILPSALPLHVGSRTC